MRVPASLRRRQKRRGGFAARCPKKRQGLFASHFLQTRTGPTDFFAILFGRPDEVFALGRPGRWTHPKLRRGARCARHVGAPVGVVIGVRGKLVAFCSASFPPTGPVRAQAAVAGFGAFIGGKKRHLDLVPIQHVSDQRCHFHVARVQSQVHRLAGSIGNRIFLIKTGLCACCMGASSYPYDSKKGPLNAVRDPASRRHEDSCQR